MSEEVMNNWTSRIAYSAGTGAGPRSRIILSRGKDEGVVEERPVKRTIGRRRYGPFLPAENCTE